MRSSKSQRRKSANPFGLAFPAAVVAGLMPGLVAGPAGATTCGNGAAQVGSWAGQFSTATIAWQGMFAYIPRRNMTFLAPYQHVLDYIDIQDGQAIVLGHGCNTGVGPGGTLLPCWVQLGYGAGNVDNAYSAIESYYAEWNSVSSNGPTAQFYPNYQGGLVGGTATYKLYYTGNQLNGGKEMAAYIATPGYPLQHLRSDYVSHATGQAFAQWEEITHDLPPGTHTSCPSPSNGADPYQPFGTAGAETYDAAHAILVTSNGPAGSWQEWTSPVTKNLQTGEPTNPYSYFSLHSNSSFKVWGS